MLDATTKAMTDTLDELDAHIIDTVNERDEGSSNLTYFMEKMDDIIRCASLIRDALIDEKNER